MRTNYVLVDLENVQPESLDLLALDHFKLLVFVGANQTKLHFEMAASVQRLGERAEYIKIPGNGSNALDFHIAYYMGQLVAAEPSAFFHIVSRDAGFDPLIQHLRTKKVFADRVKSIADIPLVRSSNSKAPGDQVAVVLAKLQQLKAAKPRKVATLSSTIGALFQKQLSETEVTALVQNLADQGHTTIAGTSVSYALPSDA